MTFKEIVEEFKAQSGGDISQAQLARMLGWSDAVVSQMLNEKYPGSVEAKKAEARRKLLGEGNQNREAEFRPFEVRPDVLVRTESFVRTYDLLDDLNRPESSLTASIGLVTGAAGRGKTTVCKAWAAEHPGGIYCLYMGYTCSALFRRIAQLMTGRSYMAYVRNIELIEESSHLARRVLIIDEADRMARPTIDNLRALNEAAHLPIVLVGEPTLEDMAAKIDRLGSRIRKPRIAFQKLDHVTLQTLYLEAAGIELPEDIAQLLLKKSRYDFRIAANDLQLLVKLLNQNRRSEVTLGLIREAFRC